MHLIHGIEKASKEANLVFSTYIKIGIPLPIQKSRLLRNAFSG